MADPEQKWPANAPGTYYVDRECIDCDLCRTTAPAHFARSEEGYSFLSQQPSNEEEQQTCRLALEECPVDAIGDDGSP